MVDVTHLIVGPRLLLIYVSKIIEVSSVSPYSVIFQTERESAEVTVDISSLNLFQKRIPAVLKKKILGRHDVSQSQSDR